MVIAIQSLEIAYQALPKAGCSSVKKALAQAEGRAVHHSGADGLRPLHDLYPTMRFARRRWRQVRGWHRFCVVRDPARRLMSAYTDIVAGRGALSHSRRLRRAGTLPVDPDADTFFCNLDGYRALSSLVKHHVLGAELFLGPDLRHDYDRVWRSTELDALGRDLADRSGRWVVMPRANRSAVTLTLHDLSGAAIDAIRPLLDQEYAYLSNYYQNPLGVRVHRACAVPVRRVS